MAGEWIKFESSLPEKPETLAITAAMGWTDPDLTVGKLMRVFRWFDQQTVDGNAARVTPALLDHVLGVTGLTQAVASVGWISITEDGLSLSKFDRHNGESAKQRAQTAKRVAKHKSNAKANEEVTHAPLPEALPREEKRREEKREAKASSATAYAAPEWVPVEQWAAFVQMRKAMRNVPFTEAAAKGVVAELKKFFDAGHDPAALLQSAVTNGWRTVYEPKGGAKAQSHAGGETAYQRSMRERVESIAPGIAAKQPGNLNVIEMETPRVIAGALGR